MVIVFHKNDYVYDQEVNYINAVSLALTMSVLIVTTATMVLAKFSRTRTINKLTLLPFFML